MNTAYYSLERPTYVMLVLPTLAQPTSSPRKGKAVSSSPPFNPQLIGQTEKTLNAILDRHLAEVGLTEQHWIMLTLAVTADGTVDRDELVKQVVNNAKFSEEDVRARVTELVARQLFDDSRSPVVTVTDDG